MALFFVWNTKEVVYKNASVIFGHTMAVSGVNFYFNSFFFLLLNKVSHTGLHEAEQIMTEFSLLSGLSIYYFIHKIPVIQLLMKTNNFLSLLNAVRINHLFRK